MADGVPHTPYRSSSPDEASRGLLIRRGDGLKQVGDDAVGVDALGLGVEGGDDPVPQDGGGDVADVGHGGVDAAFEQGAGLGADDQTLAGARAGAPGNMAADELGGLGLVGPGGADDV